MINLSIIVGTYENVSFTFMWAREIFSADINFPRGASPAKMYFKYSFIVLKVVYLHCLWDNRVIDVFQPGLWAIFRDFDIVGRWGWGLEWGWGWGMGVVGGVVVGAVVVGWVVVVGEVVVGAVVVVGGGGGYKYILIYNKVSLFSLFYCGLSNTYYLNQVFFTLQVTENGSDLNQYLPYELLHSLYTLCPATRA